VNTCIDQFFKAGGVFQNSFGEDSIFLFDMAAGEIF